MKKIIRLILPFLFVFTFFGFTSLAKDNKDVTPIIKSISMIYDNKDLFSGVVAENYTESMLNIDLNYDASNMGFKIEKGDSLSIKLRPTDYNKDFIRVSYSSSNYKVLEADGVKIADIDTSSRDGIDFIFENLSASFTAKIKLPFEINSSILNNYFKNHPDQDKVEFTYELVYNGKSSGKILKGTLNKPNASTKEAFLKTRGIYEMRNNLGEGEMFYNIQMGTKLLPNNEFVIYDTPDVNLRFDGNIKIASPLNFGGIDNILHLENGHYIDSSSLPDEQKMEIFVYDIYFKTLKSSSITEPRQADYEEENIWLPRKDIVTGKDQLLSMEKAAVPKNILLEKPVDSPLTENEKKLIDDNGGLNKEVGKGFKIRIKNFKSDSFSVGGNLTLIYKMTIVNNSPLLDENLFSIYKNSASYYGQEIPNCDPSKETNCIPIRCQKATLNDVRYGLTTRGAVNKGSITAEIDRYSNVDFTKVEINNNTLIYDKKLSGAVFNIYKVLDNNKKEIATTKSGVKLENVVTNDDGKLCISGNINPIDLMLERGNYIFEEVKAPQGYEISKNETLVTVGFINKPVYVGNKKKDNSIPENSSVTEDSSIPNEPEKSEEIQVSNNHSTVDNNIVNIHKDYKSTGGQKITPLTGDNNYLFIIFGTLGLISLFFVNRKNKNIN